MTTSASYPDIEIYIREADIDPITEWLDARFGIREHSRSGQSLTCHLENPAMDCVIVERAAKQFTSVWFKSGETPWQTDADCAREAFERLGLEVRCSTGPWQEDGDDDEWLAISDDGEKVIQWL